MVASVNNAGLIRLVWYIELFGLQ